MIDFYPYFSNLCAESIRNGNALEQAVFDTCELAIYSSEWAAQTAIDNYKVNPQKVKVVPFGANIICNRNAGDIGQIAAAKDKKICNLFFLGVEWERKGGDMALEVAKLLNENGLPTTLHIAGLKELPLKNLPAYVKNYGFIDKSTMQGEALLNTLFEESHFLILPSKADCTPVVYGEANSFGLPCISTNVGGIPTLIKDDINGKKFALVDGAEKYAACIESYFSNYPSYLQFCKTAFNEYETRLNWQSSGKAIMKMLNEI
jgi:glycosyltransferase involved in cell wall biosynthesis